MSANEGRAVMEDAISRLTACVISFKYTRLQARWQATVGLISTYLAYIEFLI